MGDPALLEPAFAEEEDPDAVLEIERDPSMSLQIPMDDDEREALGKRVCEEITRYYAQTESRRENLRQWRRDYALLPLPPSTRWPNGSEVPAPFTRMTCDSHHQRLNTQIIHSNPPFVIDAKDQEAVDLARPIEHALTGLLEEARWSETADLTHLELPQAGDVFLRVTWEKEYKRIPYRKVEFDTALFESLLKAKVDPLTAQFQAAKKVKFEHETIVTHDGIKFRVVPWEDGVIFPALVRDPEKCYGIGERLMIRGEDLRLGAKTGKYIKAAVDELLEMDGDAPPEDRYERLDEQGVDLDESGPCSDNPLHRDYLCYEVCWKDDFDDDGLMEWAVLTVHHGTEKLVQAQWLDYEHGDPYYHLLRYFPRAGELFWEAIAEKIACYQDAGNALLNQLIDAGDLALSQNGNFFFDPMSNDFRPDKFEMQLGRPVAMTDPQRTVQAMPQVLIPQHTLAAIQMLKDYVEILTASSNPALGKATDADKTLGEVQIVVGAAQMIFEEMAARVARQWARVADHVRLLAAQYASDNGKVRYRITAEPGRPEFHEIDAEILAKKVDLVPAGLKQFGDMQSRFQRASLTDSFVQAHKLTAMSPEAWLISFESWLDEINHPQAEKLKYAAGIEAQKQRVLMDLQMGMQMGALMAPAAPPPGEPGAPAPEGGALPEGGNPTASNLPEDQGPAGAPPGILEGATTGVGGTPMPPIPGGTR